MNTGFLEEGDVVTPVIAAYRSGGRNAVRILIGAGADVGFLSNTRDAAYVAGRQRTKRVSFQPRGATPTTPHSEDGELPAPILKKTGTLSPISSPCMLYSQ